MVGDDPALRRPHGGRRYSVGWSYYDRVWSVSRSGLSGLKLPALTGELDSLNTI